MKCFLNQKAIMSRKFLFLSYSTFSSLSECNLFFHYVKMCSRFKDVNLDYISCIFEPVCRKFWQRKKQINKQKNKQANTRNKDCGWEGEGEQRDLESLWGVWNKDGEVWD